MVLETVFKSPLVGALTTLYALFLVTATMERSRENSCRAPTATSTARPCLAGIPARAAPMAAARSTSCPCKAGCAKPRTRLAEI